MEELVRSLLDGAHPCPVQWGYFKDGEGLPRVTLTRLSGNRQHSLNSKGLMRSRVQVDCFAADVNELIGISRALRGALEGFRQNPILNSRLVGIRDGSNETGVHRTSLTFAITYRE